MRGYQFEQIEPGDFSEEEILEKEMLAVTEVEVVTASSGVSSFVERVTDAIPLVVLVRRSTELEVGCKISLWTGF